MCRGCLFVKVDVSSGGDIDGCIKNDVIDEFKNVKYIDLLRAKEKALMVLNYEESLIDEENCVEELKQPESANEEEDEFLATLPAPLNNVDAEFTLKWNLKDVALDKAAYVFCKVYHTYHTLEMLEAKSVGELRIIAIVVGAHLADKKPKLIHNILVKQSEGAWSIYGIKGEP